MKKLFKSDDIKKLRREHASLLKQYKKDRYDKLRALNQSYNKKISQLNF